MDDAFKYIISNHGIDTEASYPYVASDQKLEAGTAWERGYSPTSTHAVVSFPDYVTQAFCSGFCLFMLARLALVYQARTSLNL